MKLLFLLVSSFYFLFVSNLIQCQSTIQASSQFLDLSSTALYTANPSTESTIRTTTFTFQFPKPLVSNPTKYFVGFYGYAFNSNAFTTKMVVNSIDTTNIIVSITAGSFVSMSEIGLTYFATNQAGIHVISQDFSNHPNFNTFASGTVDRVLAYSVSYSPSNPAEFNDITVSISFNDLGFNNIGSAYQVEAEIVSKTNSLINFNIIVKGDTQLVSLKGTILIISNSLRDNYGFNGISAYFSDLTLVFPPTSDTYSSFNRVTMPNRNYRLNPLGILLCSQFSVSTITPSLVVDYNLAFFNDQPLFNIYTRTYGNTIWSYYLDIYTFCDQDFTCLTQSSNPVIQETSTDLDFTGLPVARSDLGYYRYLTIDVNFPLFYAQNPKYIALGINGIKFKSDMKSFKMKLISSGGKGATLFFEVAPYESLLGISPVFITSDSDVLQSIFVEFDLHQNFNTNFGVVITGTKYLDYYIAFNQTEDITFQVKSFATFTEFNYSNTPSKVGFYAEQIYSNSTGIILRVYSEGDIIWKSLKGYVVIHSLTSSKFNTDSTSRIDIMTTINSGSGARSDNFIGSTSRRYLKNPDYIGIISGFRWLINPGNPNLASISFEIVTNPSIDPSTNIVNYAYSISSYDTSIIDYSYTTVLTFGMNEDENRLIFDPIRISPNPSIDQYVSLQADFSLFKTSYLLVISNSKELIDNTIIRSVNSDSNTTTMIKALKIQNDTIFQGFLRIPPLTLPKNLNLTFHFLKIKYTPLSWNIHLFKTAFFHDYESSQIPDDIYYGPFPINGGSLPKDIEFYKTIVATSLLEHSSNVILDCHLEIEFFGILRSLYINEEYFISGSSIDKNISIRLISDKNFRLTPKEYIQLTAIGHYLQIKDFKLQYCRDLSNNNVSNINVFPYEILSKEISSIEMAYPSTTSCSADCKICRNSSYCLECIDGLLNSNGLCYQLCPNNHPIPIKARYCDDQMRSYGVRAIAPLYSDSNKTIQVNYDIDSYTDTKTMVTFFSSFDQKYSNNPIVYRSNQIPLLAESQFSIVNLSDVSSNFSIYSQQIMKLTANLSNPFIRLSIYSLIKDRIQITELANFNSAYALSSVQKNLSSAFLIIDSTKNYKFQFFLICYSASGCKMIFNHTGKLEVYMNERTMLYSYNSTSQFNYDLKVSFKNLNQITLELSKSTMLNLTIKGNYSIYSLENLMMEDKIPVPETYNCSIQNCINCESQNHCLSCESGYFLSTDRAKCVPFCFEKILPTVVERRCFCVKDSDCLLPEASKCDLSVGTCKPCKINADCSQTFPSLNPAICQSGMCILCPLNCESCLNSSTCTTCKSGYKLSNGSCDINCAPGLKYIDSNTCIEFCGDGIKSASVPADYCDDGNNVDGDGCGSTCKIETHFGCSLGGPTIPDICGPIPQLKINQDEKIRNIIYLKFDVDMKSIQNDKENIILSTEEPNILEFNVSAIRINSSTFYIYFLPSKTLFQQSLTLSFKNIHLVLSNQSISPAQSSYEFLIDPIPYKTKSDDEIIDFLTLLVKCLLYASGLSAGIVIIIDKRTTSIWNMIALLQNFFYLLLINVDLPANANQFLKVYSVGRLNFLYNIFELFFNDLSLYSLPSSRKFSDQDIDGLWFINLGSMLFIWTICYLLYFISYLLHAFGKNYCIPLRKFFIRYKDRFEWSFALRIWMVCFYEIALCSLIQIKNFSYNNHVDSSSSGLSVVFLFGCISVLTFTYLKTYSINNILKNTLLRYNSIIEGIKRKSPCKYQNTLLMVRRLSSAIVLVYFCHHPFIQIMLLVMINVIPCLITVITNPFIDKFDCWVNTVMEIALILCQILIFGLVFDNKNDLITDNNRGLMGWSIIILSLIAFFIAFGFIMFQLYESIKLALYFKTPVKYKITKKVSREIDFSEIPIWTYKNGIKEK